LQFIMRHAELITYGLEDDAAERLRTLLSQRGVGVRTTRQPGACLNLLRQGATGVLLLRVGRDLEVEFDLLARTAQQFPHVAPVVCGDADHPRLAGLAWDLGASAVFMPPPDLQRLGETIVRLLPE
jgi:DNA-binding NtrC family response regulator